MNETSSIGIVHIVHAAYGLAPFDAFLAALHDNPPGCDHELVVVAKAFADRASLAALQSRLDGIPHRLEQVDDGGYDIGTYRVVAARLPHRRLCFLNSRARPLAPGWLAALDAALDTPGVVAVGASGSWQSLSTDAWRAARAAMRRSPVRGALSLAASLRHRWHYPPFPNPHLRTNGFLIDADTWRDLQVPPIVSKLDAMRFESGWHGMTRQLRRRGEVLLVGRDGARHAVDRWPGSGIFWQQDQPALLIGDNQTDAYAAAAREEREVLHERAWVTPDRRRLS